MKCSGPECKREAKTTGLCIPCYKHAWRRRTGRINPRQVVSAEEKANRAVLGSRRWREENPTKSREAAAAYREANAQTLRERRASDEDRKRRIRARVLKKYGTTPEEVAQMIKDQGGLCAVCGERLGPNVQGRWDQPVVDHCEDARGRPHARGILHRTCNSTLGLLAEEPELFDKAAAYLRRHAWMSK